MGIKRAAIYARSTKDRHDVSVEAQVRELRAAVDKDRYELVAEFIEAAPVSAKSDDRPAFQEMIAAAKTRPAPFERIYCYDTSRFTRSREDAAIYKALLRKRQGIQIVFLKVPSTDSYIDQMIEGMMEVFDEFHSIKSKHDALRGMKENVLRGYRAGGRAPLGYRLKKHVLGTNMDKGEITKSTLEPDPDWANTVREYFKLRAAGNPRKAVCRELVGPGGEKIKNTTALNMERNIDTYLGHTVWGKHNPHDKDGYHGTTKFRPEDQWTVTRDTHEALCTQEQADIITARLRSNTLKGQRPKVSPYILSGVLVCGVCGGPVVGAGAGAYRCNKNLREGKAACPGVKISQQKIEGAVWWWLEHEYFNENAMKTAVNKARALVEKSKGSEEKEAGRLRQQIGKLDAKITRLFALYEDGAITRDAINKEVGQLEGQKLALQSKLAEVEKPKSTELIVTREALANVDLGASASTETLPLRKELLREIISSATLQKQEERQKRALILEFRYTDLELYQSVIYV